MYSKPQQDILKFLATYLKETPSEVIAQEIKAISAIPYAGATAAHYFANFHKYYQGEAFDLPETVISAKGMDITLSTKAYKLALTTYTHLLPYNLLQFQSINLI
jgi:hypothetical protein